MSEPINFILKKGNSLLKLVEQAEKNEKTVSWEKAKVLWDDFVNYHELVLKNYNENQFVPVVDYDESAQNYYSDKMLQKVKTTIQGILDALTETNETTNEINQDPLERLKKICLKFHIVARQLRDRYDDRTTLDVSDEYDVQDLLHALLKIDFNDIRKEEWTPSYAGSSSRMDFLLKNEKLVVETKKTRKGLGSKEVGDQLLVDIERYRQHPDFKTLFCFVYDPEGKISNPDGIERDLSKQTNGMNVIVFITPKGY